MMNFKNMSLKDQMIRNITQKQLNPTPGSAAALSQRSKQLAHDKTVKVLKNNGLSKRSNQVHPNALIKPSLPGKP